MEERIPPIAFVIAGAILVMVLARYFPKIGGFVAILLVLVMLIAAQQKGVFRT